jgi:DNA-binding NarL/FixJ family response regulator
LALSPVTLKKAAPRENLRSRVLVFDAEPLVLWSLHAALRQAGFDVVAARTADEAREVASHWPPPRVALLDVAPEDCGRQLIADLRRIYPECRFLVLSTDRGPGCARCDVPVIQKPFDVADVVRRVALAVGDGEP